MSESLEEKIRRFNSRYNTNVTLDSIDGTTRKKLRYLDEYMLGIKKESSEPSTSGIDKNKRSVAKYIGCLTMPYSPVSTTF